MDIRVTGAQEFIHHDSILNFQSCCLSQLDVRLDAEPGHHAVHLNFPRTTYFQNALAAPRFQTNNLFACQQFNTLLLVEVGDKLCQRERENAVSNVIAGENHHYFFSGQSQGRGDLRTDKSSTNYRKPLTLFGERSQALVIRQGAEVNDFVLAKRKPARPAPVANKSF